jgi:hypothetical protein
MRQVVLTADQKLSLEPALQRPTVREANVSQIALPEKSREVTERQLGTHFVAWMQVQNQLWYLVHTRHKHLCYQADVSTFCVFFCELLAMVTRRGSTHLRSWLLKQLPVMKGSHLSKALQALARQQPLLLS